MNHTPTAVSARGGHHSREVDFIVVHERLAPLLDSAGKLGTIPVLGSPAWADIALDDVRWKHSVIVAGYEWARREWLEQDAMTDLSKSLSVQYDWGDIARHAKNHAAYRADNPWAVRRTA